MEQFPNYLIYYFASVYNQKHITRNLPFVKESEKNMRKIDNSTATKLMFKIECLYLEKMNYNKLFKNMLNKIINICTRN